MPSHWVLLAFIAFPVYAHDVHETLKSKKLVFHFRSRPIANLVWQLDSMAGLAQGDGGAYRRFWKDKFDWNAQDDQQLERWIELSKRYRRQSLSPIGDSPYPVNCPTPYSSNSGVARNQNVRIAALEATDLRDYQQRLLQAIPPRDAVKFGLIVAHFDPRFQKWWRSKGENAGEELVLNFKDAMHEYAMAELAQQLAAFTEAQLNPDHEVTFHLMVRPARYGDGIAGTQIRNHMIAEMGQREHAAPRLSLLMHELMHHFYDSAPVEKHTALVRTFLEAPEPHSMGLYTYLNEAIATAVGILVDARVQTPQRLVGHLADDRRVSLDRTAAKLAIGIYLNLEKHLRQRRTLFDGFAPIYIASGCKALGDFALGPQLELASRTIIVRNPRALPAMNEFVKRVHAITTLAGRRPLIEYQQLSGVVFLLTGELQWLLGTTGIIPKEARALIRKASAQNAAFVFGARRSNKAGVYVLIGDDQESLRAVQRQFAANQKPFAGVRFAIKRQPQVESAADKIGPPIPPVPVGGLNASFVERSGADPHY